MLSALEVALCLGYVAVGLHYARRARGPGGEAPARFAAFWLALGGYGILEGAWSVAMSTLTLPYEVGVTVLQLKILLAAVGFFGLSSYLLRLYTGRSWDRLAAAYHAVAYVLLVYAYAAARPIGQEVQAWRGGLVYASSGGALNTLAPLLLFAPALVGSIAFLLLARHAHGAARRRVIRLGAALFVFLAGLSLGWLNAAWFWWPLVEKTLALVAILGAMDAVLGSDARVDAGRGAPLVRAR